MRKSIISKLSAAALVGGLAVAVGTPGAGSYATKAGAAPQIGQIETFAAPGGRLLVHTEVLRGRTAKPSVVRFTVLGRTAQAQRESLDGSEGPRYRVDYNTRFAPSGTAFRVGNHVRVTVRACTATCTTISKRVPIEPFADR
jgi:hypothetical protein